MDQALPPLTRAGERVLAAAAELFYAHGIGAVGVALVAERAGVTKKTLYDCFGSKDALVVRYLQRRHRRWWDHLEERLAGAERPRALILYDASLDHAELDTRRGCAFLNAAAEIGTDHPGTAVIRDHKHAARHRLGELVAEDRPDASAAEVAELTELLFLVLEGATAQLALGDREHVGAARRLAEHHLAAAG